VNTRSIHSELEFDTILRLVAAHARTRVGRSFIESSVGLAAPAVARRAADLTEAVGRLIEDDGTLVLSGVDDAEPWLEPGTPMSTDPAELLHLVRLARRIAAVRERLLKASPVTEVLSDLGARLPDTRELVAWAAPRLGRDGRVPDDASPELARLRRLIARLRQDLVARLEAIRRGHPDVATDAPPTVRRDRYCLAVRATVRSRLPGLLLDVSGTGSTAFVEPFEIVEGNNELVHAVAAETEEVRRLVAEVAAAFAEVRDDLLAACGVLGELDAAQARVVFGAAVDGRLVRPVPDHHLRLVGARHPLLDERLSGLRTQVFGDRERRDPERRAVPLDLELTPDIHTLVISGPNAGGKTIVLKTVGLMVLMASWGIPLPVADGTTLPEVSHVWCHIGDEQDVAADLSTFSGAMAATAELLETASDDTLVLYDELGAGTDPLEGAALGCALLEELVARGSTVLATTHLAAIAMSATTAPGMDNAAMEYDEEAAGPTYRLRVGRPGRSRGLEIAHRMGVATTVLDRARDLLGGDHLELDRWLRRLEDLETQLERERVGIARDRTELERDRTELERDRAEIETARLRIPEELTAERDRLRRQAKERLDAALARLDTAIAEREALGKRRREQLRREALALDAGTQTSAPVDDAGREPEVGDVVRVATLGAAGELVERRGSQALVVVRGKRTWVAAADVESTSAPPSGTRAGSRPVQVDSEDLTSRELKLIGLDTERAREDLERFLDRAFASGAPSVRIVHGHGTGALRRMVTDVCRRHPAVRSYRHPPQHLGGTGATEIQLAETLDG
jgi:DNA mismatch repair protein MutS2